MIRPLRQRHRRAFFALGIILPIAFITGLALRRPVPAIASGAGAFEAEPLPAGHLIWERGDLWPQFPIRTRVFSIGASGKFAVELSVTNEIVKPDLLVYWSPSAFTAANSLPGNAILLGAFVQAIPTPLFLPDGAATNFGGTLLLYSLADHEVVAVSKPLEIGKRGNPP